MLETLTPQPQDKILALIAMFRDDPRTTKIDLGVGVYRTGQGDTPVFAAVKAACDAGDRVAIVIAADVAEYARGSTGEQTQGAGAVA